MSIDSKQLIRTMIFKGKSLGRRTQETKISTQTCRNTTHFGAREHFLKAGICYGNDVYITAHLHSINCMYAAIMWMFKCILAAPQIKLIYLMWF